MKIFCRIILTFCIALYSISSHAAIHVVTPGQDAQTVVNAAASGDLVRFLPGTYGDLSIINKDLTLKVMGTTPATLGNVEINGSKITMIKLGAASLKANDLPSDPTKLVALQGTFGTIETNATESHIAYSNVTRLVFSGKGSVTACEFNGDAGGIGVDVHGSTTQLVLRNNLIRNYKIHTNSSISESCIGIRLRDGAKANILNNIVHGCYETDGGGHETNCGIGIFLKAGTSATASGNIIFECFVNNSTYSSNAVSLTAGDRLVHAEGAINLKNNILWNNRGDTSEFGNIHPALVGGTATLAGNLTSDPKFVNWQSGNFALQADSPAKNAGPPDAQYNDRDGSRNDIGMYGGHSYIPDGKTTNKPIVIDLQVAPIAVPVGGVITIESTGAVPK